MSEREVPAPSEVSQPFWDATRRRELLVQWCRRCDRGVHYPRAVCPFCGQDELGWELMSGLGRVYAQAWHPSASEAHPGYSVALVELVEGVRMLTNLVDAGPDVPVDQPVRVAWEPLPDGRHLPLFRLLAH